MAKARESEDRCKAALEQAASALEQAAALVTQRKGEIDALREDLDKLPADDEDLYCEGEDAGLEEEFRGNVEVVRLFRQLAAAKDKMREERGVLEGDEDNGLVERTAAQRAPEAMHQSAAAVSVEMEDLEFEGDDFGDEDLEALGIGASGSGEESSAKRAKLATWFAVQTKKRLQGSADQDPKGKVRAKISKVAKKDGR